MVDAAKCITELKSLLGMQRTRRSMVFACGFMVVFFAFTIFLIFNPSDNSSSPWFNRIFITSDSNTYKSNFSSMYSFFFSDDPTPIPPPSFIFSQNSNCSTIAIPSNTSSLSSSNSTISSNNSTEISKPSNARARKDIRSSEIGVSNATFGETEKKAKMVPLDGETEKKANIAKDCDFFDGKWVRDESYPLYPEGSCLIDNQYNCFLNGRPDRDYQKLRWQPNDCNIPRLNGTDMLERLRGKRLVFVGDSLNRNMWESLVCILRNSVKDKSRVFEASGRKEFKSKGIYVFIFKDYNCSVEFFWAPFLVQEWQVREPNGTTKETLRLDLIEKMSPEFKKADVIIFNTGHWWTHEKTSKAKDFYQEGSHVYSDLNVLEAFRKAITTWARWVEANVNPNKTLVFFRGYSASHFSGGKWNSGGQCDNETEPIKNSKYLDPYLDKMIVLESVLKWMKIPVNYMNITLMTDYRKDGHPSIYRKQNMTEEELHTQLMHQDCSHWCLPGVPDSWNELLYARLISHQNQNQIKNKT